MNWRLDYSDFDQADRRARSRRVRAELGGEAGTAGTPSCCAIEMSFLPTAIEV
jgi:hypothetical protein